VVRRLGDSGLHRLDDVRVGLAVRVTDAEADDVDARLALLGDPPLDLGEHVRGHGLEPLRRLSQPAFRVLRHAREGYGLAERGQFLLEIAGELPPEHG